MERKIILFLLWTNNINYIYSNDVCEDKSLDVKHWHCENNPDGTVNVTYDCLSVPESLEIWIWSPKLPTDLSTLTIQNCGNLTLNLRKASRSVGEFRYLNVFNISQLTIYPECRENEDCDHFCVTANVVFSNVTINTAGSYFAKASSSCETEGTALRSLELKDVLINNIESRFIYSKHLRQLIMERVKIKLVKLSRAGVIYLTNKKGTIKIINSEIDTIDGVFINCKISQVTISNSTVLHFNERFYDTNDKVFAFEADNVVLNGNQMKILSDNTFRITSNNVQITNNIFHRVDEKAFNNIAPFKPATNSSLVLSNLFNFSNNVIYSVAPGALMIPLNDTNRNAIFTNITIFNNSVNCTCENMFWFESVAQNKHNVRNYFNYKWAKKGNRNSCLNLPKCDVSQVLNNFHELCEDYYRCPEMAADEGKEKVANFINYNNEMGRETSKLLELLLNQMEESKTFKELQSSGSQDKHVELLVERKLVQEEQKWMNFLNFNEISSCLVIITCLTCGVVFYILIAKILNSSFLKTLTSKYRTRSFVSETEMNPSCRSDFT